MENKNGMLYPLMILAAISVIIFSVVGIATMTGQVPNAFSSAHRAEPVAARQAPAQVPAPAQQGKAPAVAGVQPAAAPGRPAQGRDVIAVSDCANCGVIESIREVEVKGQGTGVGMAVGGVAGGLLGNQIGHGGGRTVATIAGAAGGAYVGNEIEKNQRSHSTYRVTVRMEDGTYRTVTQRNHPGRAVGERVKLVDGAIVAARG